MNNDLRVIQWSLKQKTQKVKKRTSNPFLLFRNELKKLLTVNGNMQMTQVSKIAAELWENASEDEKAFWQRQYEINRDFKNETTDEVEIFGTDFSPLPTNNYQMNDLSFPAELVQFENDFLFCNFCQNLLDANVEFCPCLKTLYDTNEFSCYPTCNELPNYHLPNGEIFNIQDSYITEFPNNINFNLFNT